LEKDFPIDDSGIPEKSFGGFPDTLKKNEGGRQHRRLGGEWRILALISLRGQATFERCSSSVGLAAQ
jgi:hypothetical protein